MEPLDDDQIASALAGLDGWERRDDALHREFRFGDFREAIAFIVRLGFEAEQLGHHPELTNVYNRVGVTFTTHDAGNRITGKDVEMARAANRVAV